MNKLKRFNIIIFVEKGLRPFEFWFTAESKEAALALAREHVELYCKQKIIKEDVVELYGYSK